MGSISYETYLQAIRQIHENPKHLLIRGLHSSNRDSLKTITNLSLKFKSTISQNYKDAKLLASELKRMSERKIQKELQKNLLIRTICQLFEKFTNWKEKNGWNTNAEFALKMSKLFAAIPAPAPRILVQQAPRDEIPQVHHQEKKAEVLEKPVILAKTEEVKEKFIPPIVPTREKTLTPTNTPEKTFEKISAKPAIPSPTLKAGTIRFNALTEYKNNPQECKPFDKMRIWGDVIEVEGGKRLATTTNSITNLKDLILFMTESDLVDLSNPVCDPFILDLFTYGKAQLMSDFTTWVVNQKGFNTNLLNSICTILAQHLADKSKYADAYIIDILLAKVRTFYKDYPQSCTHPNVLLAFKVLLKIDSNHGKAVEYIEWLKEVNKIDLDTFKNLMSFFVEKNRDSNFEYPIQNVLLSVYKSSNWKELLDREPSENKKLIDYLNKLENPAPVKPVEEPKKKETAVDKQSNISSRVNNSNPSKSHIRTPIKTIGRSNTIKKSQKNIADGKALNLIQQGIALRGICSIRKSTENENEDFSLETAITILGNKEVDFSDQIFINLIRDALPLLHSDLLKDLFEWISSHQTFSKDIFLQCALHYTGADNISREKLPGLQVFINGYQKIHETLPLNHKDVLALYSTLLKYASNDPQTEKQLDWIFKQPEFDLAIFKILIKVFYDKQIDAKKTDKNVTTITSSVMTMLVKLLATKTDWETTLQASKNSEDQKLMEYIQNYRKK